MMLDPATKRTRKAVKGALRGERRRAKVQQVACVRCHQKRRRMAKHEVAVIDNTTRPAWWPLFPDGAPTHLLNGLLLQATGLRLKGLVRRIAFGRVCLGCLTHDEAIAEGLRGAT